MVVANPSEPFGTLIDPSLHAAAPLTCEARLGPREVVKLADVGGLNIHLRWAPWGSNPQPAD